MLIGAHVSTAGGLAKAHERGIERGCKAIQVFNQSPRQWRPTRWSDDDIAEFRERERSGPIRSVTIHAVYLINPATKDREMRKKSGDSLVHALRMGDEIGAPAWCSPVDGGEPIDGPAAVGRCSSTRSANPRAAVVLENPRGGQHAGGSSGAGSS